MTGRARLAAFLVAAFALAVGASTLRPTWSGWTDTTMNAGIFMSAAPDWEAPALGTAVVGKSAGGITGYIHKGGTYYVYANVTDGGNPASGTSTVTTSVSSITFGGSAVVLSAGSFTAQGVSYNRRSTLLLAGATLAAGGYTTSITTADIAGNDATVTGPAVITDNTSPAGSSFHTANAGAIAGRPDAGDRLMYTWSEQLDPYSVLSTFSGTAAAAHVVITNSGTNDDSVTVRSANGVTQLPFGAVDLNDNYVTATSTFDATMTQSGAVITVTLGALASGTPSTDTSGTTTSWATGTPAGATDRAGNALATSTVTESGTTDYEF
jgi:hypothetical protein